MIISVLLTAFMLATLVVGVVMRRRSPAVSLALVAASLAGIWFAWMPAQLTAVAHFLGVGRGTDLALYLWISISFLALAGLTLQLRHVQRNLTLIAREVAMARARSELRPSAPGAAFPAADDVAGEVAREGNPSGSAVDSAGDRR